MLVLLRAAGLLAVLFRLGRRRDGTSRRPSLLEYTVHKRVGVLRVQLPETAFAWLVLAARHFQEALIEGEVVADGILERGKTKGQVYSIGTPLENGK